MLALISFIIIILIVVSVHEYGHYLAARHLGVRVLRFSVGFGKPLFRVLDKRGTEWVFAPILLGGYVRLLDKATAEKNAYPLSESMEVQSPLRRIIIYAAGPFANIVLSFCILLFLLAGGERGLPPQVDEVRSGSAAAAAGIVRGSELVRINGDAVLLWQQVDAALADAVIHGDDIIIDSQRGSRYVIAAETLSLDDIAHNQGAAGALGIYPDDRYIKLQIATVLPDSAAAAGGVQPGDELVMLDGVVLEHWREAVALINAHPNETVPLLVWRNEQVLTLTVTPTARSAAGRADRGYLGVAPVVDRAALAAQLVTVSYSPPALVAAAFNHTVADVGRALSFFKLLFSTKMSRDYISGPVGIAAQSGEAAARGVAVWLRFVTLISISLAILNLLPLPLLDGGHILLAMVQWLTRRPLTDQLLRVWHAAGAVVLLMLMVFVIINDIVQLF